MFNPSYFQNSMTAGAGYIEVVQNYEDEHDPRRLPEPKPVFMPLQETAFSGTVTGPVARLRISHHFGHPQARDGSVLEAVYRFPLPGDAAVTGVQVTFGETLIRAELADREDAESYYDDARATGRQAVLVSRESPDVFSMYVSGIESGQDVHVVTDFVLSLRPERRGFSLRLPLTPAPRYSSDAGYGGRHEHGQPLASVADPGHRVNLDLTVAGAAAVTSRTHQLTLAEDAGGRLRLTLADGEIVPDRDLVIDFIPPAESDRPTLQTFTWHDEYEYFLTMVHPPESPASDVEIGREIILLVDRSGSMSGAKWQAADWTVSRFLSSLRPDDHFSVGLFHTSTRWFSRVAVPASPENVRAAQSFVNAYDDSGGTHLELALKESLTCGRASGDLSRHVVVITDAQVSNARDNLELARTEAKRPDRRRISLLCIDAAPNSHLVKQLAAEGGGHASYLTSDPDEGDIATALDDLMELWNQPVATGLSLRVNRPDVWVTGRDVIDEDASDGEHGRIDLGDLPAGRPLWVVGRTSILDSPLRVELIDRHDGVIASDHSPVRSDVALKSLFGAGRINALEYRLEPTGFALSRQHRSTGSDQELRRQLIAESIDYGLVCSETSFIAVREEAGKLVQRGAIVPNAMPHGWEREDTVYRVVNIETDSRRVPRQFGRGTEQVFQERFAASASFQASPVERRAGHRATGGSITLFDGIPESSGDETVLYEEPRFRRSGRLTAMRVSTGDDDDGSFDGLLELYVGRSDHPRASIRLRDVLNQNGVRPLNIRISRRDQIRLVLRDVVGSEHVPAMTIHLVWE